MALNEFVQTALDEEGYEEGSDGYTKYGSWYGLANADWCVMFISWCANQAGIMTTSSGNVKKSAVGKHPKSEKHGNTAQFSEVERSGTQENCGGIGSGCRLRLRPLPVLHRRQSQRVARIDPNAVVVDKNIAENDRFDLFSRQLVRRNLIDLLFLERGEKTFHPCVVEAMSGAAETLYHAAARQLGTKG